MTEESALGVVRGSVGLRLLRLAALAWLLGWALLHGVPAWLDGTLVLLDEADPLGPTPYLAVFVTVVNVHHYFMDSVIWRRDNPEMALLRD